MRKKKEAYTGRSGYISAFLVKKWYRYFIGIGILLVVDLLQTLIPRYLQSLIDHLKSANNTEIIVSSLQIVLLISLGIFFARFFWRWFIVGSSREFEKYLRNRLFSKLLSLSPSFYDRIKVGDIMARMTNDVNATRMMLSQGVIMLTDSIVLGVLSIYMMVTQIDWRLTLVGMIPLPFLCFIAVGFGSTIHKRFLAVQNSFSEITDLAQESLDGIRVVKSYAIQSERNGKFSEKCMEYFHKSMSLIKVWGLFFPLIELFASLGTVFTLFYGGRLVIIGDISLGQFVAFTQYLSLLVWPMIAIGWVINIIQRGRASYQRLLWIANQVSEVQEPDLPEKADLSKEISIKDLTFKYPGSSKVALKNINVSIETGQTVAFVGQTGSGKSTLAKLLVKMYSIHEGEIFIGGREIRGLSSKDIRDQVAYVPQESFLFSATIEQNIAFSNDSYDIEDVKNYAKVAAVHSNIADFPEGYKTIVGERGITLSGGQKQRVAIARALMKKTPVVILDDCLSAVDVETEMQILRSLESEIANRTTILVSHRLKAVSTADVIFVFDEGRIVETGTHTQLLSNGGMYSKLYKKQLIQEELERSDRL
jgi:ATP-binding cassette subfamily B protein